MVEEVAQLKQWQEILVASYRMRFRRFIANETGTRLAFSVYLFAPVILHNRLESWKHLYPVSLVPRRTVVLIPAARLDSLEVSPSLRALLVQLTVERRAIL